MHRAVAVALLLAVPLQETPDAASEKAKLHEDLAVAAEGVAEQLIKLKAWDEARAFLDIIRAKSDARAEALDKLLAKTEKQTSGLKWDQKSSDLIKSFGQERAKPFLTLAKNCKEKDADVARWIEAEAQILNDLLDFAKARARLSHIRDYYELPSTSFSWNLSVPAIWHARYKLLNPTDTREVEGKPGFTEEGHSVAKNAISSGRESLTELLENIRHAPFYRNYLFNPRLRSIGFGQARGASISSVIDVNSGLEDTKPTVTLLAVPKRNDNTVPVTGYDDYSAIFDGKTMRQLGYPLSLISYDPNFQPTDVEASLTLDFKSVDFYLSTPERPAGQTITPNHRKTILIVPKQPLKPNAEYKVEITFKSQGEEKHVEWTFRTAR